MTQLTKKESMTSSELLKEINIFREKEEIEIEIELVLTPVQFMLIQGALKYFYKNTKMPKKHKEQINEIIQINEEVEVDIIERLSK